MKRYFPKKRCEDYNLSAVCSIVTTRSIIYISPFFLSLSLFHNRFGKQNPSQRGLNNTAENGIYKSSSAPPSKRICERIIKFYHHDIISRRVVVPFCSSHLFPSLSIPHGIFGQNPFSTPDKQYGVEGIPKFSSAPSLAERKEGVPILPHQN